MEIIVILDKVYGKELVRPSCPQSQLLCELAGSKTFTQRMINVCKDLGYVFTVRGFESQEFKF